MRRLRIGPVLTDGVVGLAPMAGFTDPVFRGLAREHGAAFVVTELVSSEGLVRGSERTNRYLDYAEHERPLGMQLFGSNPEVMAEAAVLLEALRPDFIDINMGCPVPKVVTREAGAALLRNRPLLETLARSIVSRVKIPVTAKIRSGWDRDSAHELEELGKTLEGAGIAAVAIHARTRSEGFSGHAQWSDIARLKRAVSIPVIGNGDVRTGEDACRMLAETNCDGVLVGRGAVGNPWVFREARALLSGLPAPAPPSRGDVLDLALLHLERAVAVRGASRGVIELRKTLGAYLRGFPRASELRASLFREADHGAVVGLLEAYRVELGDAVHEPAIPLVREPLLAGECG